MVNITSFNGIYNKMHGVKRKKNETSILRDYFLKNYNDVFNFIMNNYTNLNTQKTYLAELVVFLKKNNIEHSKIKEKLTEIYNKSKEDALNKEEVITTKKKNSLINYNEYLECYKKNKHKLNIHDLLVVSLYILQPPRRIKDYHLLKYKSGSNRIYYENNDMFIELNDYKTSKTYGKFKCKIEEDLKQIIEEYIKDYDISEDDYFFGYTNSCSLTCRLKKINYMLTGKQMSLNDIRHIRISEFLQSNPSIKQKKQLAEKMGHSVSTQATYNYRNI